MEDNNELHSMENSEDPYIEEIHDDETLLERLAQVERQRDDLVGRLQDSEEAVRVLGKEQCKDKRRICELEIEIQKGLAACPAGTNVGLGALIF